MPPRRVTAPKEPDATRSLFAERLRARTVCVLAGLVLACGALPALAQEEEPAGGGEAVPPAVEEGATEPEKEEPKVDKAAEARRKKAEAAEAKRRGADEKKRKADEARSKSAEGKKQAADEKKRKADEKKRKADEARRKRDEDARRKKASRKKKGSAQAERDAAKARRKEEEARVRKPEEELIREAEILAAQVSLPPDFENKLTYQWSLPFRRPVRRDRVWIRKDIILLLTDETVLYCIRKRDGVPLWAIDLGAEPQYPPATSSRIVYVFVENRLVGIDRQAGQIIWRLDPTFAPSAAPCVADPNLYCPAWDNRIYAIQVVSRERVYFTSGLAGKTLKATEYEIRNAWHKTTGGNILATPALVEGFLYFGSEDGYLYAVSVDGEDRYRSQTQGPIRAPVTAKGMNVYVGSGDYSAYAFGRLTGSQRWALPSGANILQAAYADVPSGVAMVPSHRNGIFGVFDRQTPERGKQLWHLVDAEYIAGVSQELAYLVLTDRRLAAVEKQTGNVRWVSLLEGIREVVPNTNDWTRSDDKMRLICLTESGHLACLREAKEELRRALKQR